MPAQQIRVSGVVQGVGFRPFVWRLAHELGLNGWVKNDGQGVDIFVEGAAEKLVQLLQRLRSEAPPLARIDALHAEPVASDGCSEFAIVASQPGRIRTAIGHDTATCPNCLKELFEPADRRWRHAFITCTHCGPRYTVTRRLPYDRPQTTLDAFPLCPDCAGEYADPGNRRFHAETTCCPACGPRLALLDGRGLLLEADDPLRTTLECLRRGEIVAIKSLGGFHLVCDARNASAVARLRERKAREEKPFAVLLANIASANDLAGLTPDEAALLESPERPIVLCRKHPETDRKLPGIAPGLAWLGLMLPANPLQFLLFHEAAARPQGLSWLAQAHPLALVCTSANPGGEPLVTGNDEASARLYGIADAILLHDRDIAVRCDDSVLRMAASTPHPQFIRRARGYTPRAIRLAHGGPSVLATGGWFKNTVCLTRDSEAFVSQHIGSLDNAATCNFLEEAVAHLLDILDVAPACVAHDLHPDFYSSRFAAEFAQRRDVPCISVQHHHAHIAAVLAEHRVEEPVLGLALDGVGLGTDGSIWGGELLRVDGARCQRLGQLQALPLPGGDRAAREPWRMAAAALHLLGRAEEIPARFPDQPAAAMVKQMLERGINTPPTSSLGRVFDAAAGLLKVHPVNSFEGQAAILLEGRAEIHGEIPPLKDGYLIDANNVLDLRPLYAVLADCRDSAHGAALFHATLAAALADWAEQTARREGLLTVACGGGCFLNHLLTLKLTALLRSRGLRVLLAQQLPPNDGGLSLGQAWVARLTMDN
ncbi:MAG: carbamoyltransferase HypF [Betaproteobacteria bacterium]|nr:carbamoyltransferase HypF [Betaproteobacteria bacterium]